jgi:hypothetical protein
VLSVVVRGWSSLGLGFVVLRWVFFFFFSKQIGEGLQVN